MLKRKAKPTLTPFELNRGEVLEFELSDGKRWTMELLDTGSEVIERDYARYNNGDTGHGSGDVSAYAFHAEVMINGRKLTLRREVGTQNSFYDPWRVDGVYIWLDGVSASFQHDGGFMIEKDWREGIVCSPRKHARFAVQEADASICPAPMTRWYETQIGKPDISECYNGEDCWMGPYGGIAAHGGLDINMPAGTILRAPFDLDDQYYYCKTASGFVNNRWRGVRLWDDGAEWRIQCSHIIAPLVEERVPLKRGTPYATTAGTAVGAHEHTHFIFQVIEQGGEYLLDPWILFWQILRDADAS